MKTTLIIFCITFLLAVAVYPQTRATKSAPTLSVEGQQEAAKFWGGYVAACTGSRYVKKTHSIFVELRGFRLQMDYEPLTEADRLNGVQAKGYSRFAASAHRFYSNSAWQSWRDGIPQDMQLINAVRFQKSSGRWLFQGGGYFNDYAKTISCSELPGSQSARQNETPTGSIEISDTHRFPIQNFFIWEASSNQAGNRFAQSMATYINWKIIYTQTAFDYAPPRTESFWYKDGKLWSSADSAHFSNSSKGQLWNGKGWAEPGNWELGSYTVKIFVRGKLSVIGKFEIVNDKSATAVVVDSETPPVELTREDFTRNKEGFIEQAKSSGSTIGTGANDFWLWAKTHTALVSIRSLRGTSITVDVVDDFVTLKGTVFTLEQKKKAEQITKGIEGITGVMNALLIKN